jgi:GNAT superfamily N-acetyltransferase
MSQPGVVFVLAVAQGPQGYVCFGPSRDGDADSGLGEIRTLFVEPAAWGTGVGSALVSHTVRSLAEAGYAEATVWSFAANARANAVYERHGLRRDGSERREEAWANLPEVRYRRPVSGDYTF